MPIDWNMLTIIGTIAAFSCGGGFIASRYLDTKFTNLKENLRDLISGHEIANQTQFEKIRERLIVIETKSKINRHDIQRRN